MDINVTKTKVTIRKDIVNKGEYNIRECVFTLSSEYEGLVCKALFTIEKTNKTYEQSIVNNKCTIPYEVTVQKGAVTLGVIGYEIQDDELIKRYSPLPYHFTIEDGSYIEDIENQSTPTPSELEQLEQRVSQVEIDAEQVEINTQNISDLQENKADKSELDDFITKDVNDLTYYTLTTQTGSQIELTLNSTNFKMTATLKDKNGTVVNTSNEIDLPLESVVVNASYDSSTKELVLTLQNGTTVRVSIADLVSGLQTEITSSNKLASDLVDDSTSTNKFVTASEKAQIQTNAQDIEELQEENEAQTEQIEALQTENTRLKATLPTTTGSGENITLDKTAELEFIQPPLPRGNSEQVQLTGKNKLNVEENVSWTGVKNISVSIPAGTYKLVWTSFTKGGENAPYVRFEEASTGANLNDTGQYTITLNSTVSTVYLYSNAFSYNASQGITSSIKQLMLIPSTEAITPYEPYCGGTASPNPSYPQEITNVTGDVEVLVQNKNYFDLNKILYGEIDSNGDLSVFASTRDFYKIDFKENTQYTISGYVKRTSGNVRLRCMYTDGTYSEFFNPDASDNFSFSSFTSLANKTIDKIVVYYGSAGYLYIKDGEIQIELGSTASTYTPHKEQTYTFPLGTQRMYLGDYLADDGIHHVRAETTKSGTIITLSNAKNNGAYMCNKKTAGNLEGQTLTFNEAVTDALIEYELAEEEITPYTTEQQQAYDEIKQAISYEEQTNISGSSDESNPLFSVEAYQSIKLILASLS